MKSIIKFYVLIVLSLPLTAFALQKDTNRLLSMIGKDIRGAEIQEWLSEVEDSPEISRFDDVFFYSYKRYGISLRFDVEEKLSGIFLYSEGADDYRQYQGELPFKLSFTLTRKEIEDILGKPNKSGGRGNIKYWVIYPSKGITITYNDKSIDNLNARIYTLGIRESY